MRIKTNQISFRKDILKVVKRHFILDKIRVNKTFLIKGKNYVISLNVKKHISKRKQLYNYEDKNKNRLYNQSDNESISNEEMKENYSSNESMKDVQQKERDNNQIINNGNTLNKQESSIKNQNVDNISLSKEVELKNVNNIKEPQSSGKAYLNSKFSNEIQNNKKSKELCEKPVSLEKTKEEESNEIINIKPKGLYNLGLNCYMNSLLQCLFYIKELREFFIKNKHKFSEEQLVCKAFADVIFGLIYDEKEYFEPREFKKLIGNKNSLFEGFKAGDVKDLFFNLIDSFLTELNKEYEDNKDNEEILNMPNYSDEIQMFEESKKEIEQNNNIINQLFIGYYSIQYDCDKSKQSTYSFQTESFILFDLTKIQHHFFEENLSFELLFSYYIRRQEKSSFYCDFCKETHIGEAYEKIYRPPKILVIILDRGHGKTFKGNVEIKKVIDLKPFIFEENYKYNTIYELICVSSHRGTSSSSGHYTACCKTDNNKYYYFSDTYVKEINEENLIQDEPYLLFYRQTSFNEENMNKINKKEKDNKINNIKLQNENYNINSNNNNKNQNFNENTNKTKRYNEKEDKDNNNNNSNINNDNYYNIDFKKYEIKSDDNTKNKNKFMNMSYSYIIESKAIKYALDKFLYNFNTNYYKVDYYYSYYPQNSYQNIWKLTIIGPKNSPYEGRKFNFKLDFSKVFNYITDNITLEDNIYHLNFDGEKGKLLFDIKYEENKSFYENILELIQFIYNLFNKPNYEISSQYIDEQKLNLYINNRKKYYENCKNFYA